MFQIRAKPHVSPGSFGSPAATSSPGLKSSSVLTSTVPAALGIAECVSPSLPAG
jgi:hypothetical protein